MLIFALVAKIFDDMWKKMPKSTIFNFEVEYLSNENLNQKSETRFSSSIFCLHITSIFAFRSDRFLIAFVRVDTPDKTHPSSYLI